MKLKGNAKLHKRYFGIFEGSVVSKTSSNVHKNSSPWLLSPSSLLARSLQHKKTTATLRLCEGNKLSG